MKPKSHVFRRKKETAPSRGICTIYTYVYISDVLEHKWRARLKLHYYYMIDFNF